MKQQNLETITFTSVAKENFVNNSINFTIIGEELVF